VWLELSAPKLWLDEIFTTLLFVDYYSSRPHCWSSTSSNQQLAHRNKSVFRHILSLSLSAVISELPKSKRLYCATHHGPGDICIDCLCGDDLYGLYADDDLSPSRSNYSRPPFRSQHSPVEPGCRCNWRSHPPAVPLLGQRHQDPSALSAPDDCR